MGGDAVRHTVEVERVYAGEAAAEVAVFGGESSSRACEYAFDEGRYLIFAVTDPDDGLHTSLCSGTQPVTDLDAVPAELGAGAEPTARPATSDRPTGTGPLRSDEDGTTAADRPVPVAVGAGAVFVLAGAAVVLRLRSRRPSA